MFHNLTPNSFNCVDPATESDNSLTSSDRQIHPPIQQELEIQHPRRSGYTERHNGVRRNRYTFSPYFHNHSTRPTPHPPQLSHIPAVIPTNQEYVSHPTVFLDTLALQDAPLLESEPFAPFTNMDVDELASAHLFPPSDTQLSLEEDVSNQSTYHSLLLPTFEQILADYPDIPTLFEGPVKRENPVFIGRFDLHAMDILALDEIYLPPWQPRRSHPRYRELFFKLRERQIEGVYSSRCLLNCPEDPTSTIPTEGQFYNPDIMDPITSEVYDIDMKSFDLKPTLPLISSDRALFPAISWMPKGPAIVGRTLLAKAQVGIKCSSGGFKMKRVWAELSQKNEQLELFEGMFSLTIQFGLKYTDEGYDKNQAYRYSFWAIRGKVGSNGEIGLPLRSHGFYA